MAATVRTVTDDTRQLVATRIKSLIDNICKAYGATYDLNYVFSYPAIQNDEALRSLAKSSITKILGADQVFDFYV